MATSGGRPKLPPMTDLLSPKDLFSLIELLKPAKRILICAHRSPDGDAVGSCLGWAAYLRSLGKSVCICLPNPCPDFLKWLPGEADIVYHDRRRLTAKRLLDRADLVCCLDFNTLSRLQEMETDVQRSKAPRLLIDHHLRPDLEQFALAISHPEKSSTSEIVFRLIHQLGGYEALDADAASVLYCGMMTDTGCFTYASNDPEIFEIISLLMRKGIDRDRIYRNVFHNYSPDRLRLQGYLLYEKLQFHPSHRAALFTLTREEMKRFHFIRGDAEGLVNLPLQVKGMRLSISLREDTERDVVRVSLRSVDDFPCNLMAERFFNGGGHLNASGGELPFPLEEAVNTAWRAVEAFSNELGLTPEETTPTAQQETPAEPGETPTA